MELGARIRQARLDAGLSQRQLCGDGITRNMLSLIENGAASPSMGTLRYLAGRLNKPLRYFLEEDAPEEESLGHSWQLLYKARSAIDGERYEYARQLLEQVPEDAPELLRQKLLLLARLPGSSAAQLAARLPEMDGELLLRAKGALESGRPERCGEILLAAEDRTSPQWNLLMGQSCLARREFAPAARHLHQAEADFPQETAPLLEECYRELGDFRMAYEYACRQKQNGI